GRHRTRAKGPRFQSGWSADRDGSASEFGPFLRSAMGNNDMTGSVTNTAVSRRGLFLALAVAFCAFAAPGSTAAEPLRIVAFGDSLTAGLGLAQTEAFPVQLEAALRAKGYDVEVINAGVSGDTASGGLDRLDWSVPAKTDAVILELGANDALRATDPAVTRKSLDE